MRLPNPVVCRSNSPKSSSDAESATARARAPPPPTPPPIRIPRVTVRVSVRVFGVPRPGGDERYGGISSDGDVAIRAVPPPAALRRGRHPSTLAAFSRVDSFPPVASASASTWRPRGGGDSRESVRVFEVFAPGRDGRGDCGGARGGGGCCRGGGEGGRGRGSPPSTARVGVRTDDFWSSRWVFPAFRTTTRTRRLRPLARFASDSKVRPG